MKFNFAVAYNGFIGTYKVVRTASPVGFSLTHHEVMGSIPVAVHSFQWNLIDSGQIKLLFSAAFYGFITAYRVMNFNRNVYLQNLSGHVPGAGGHLYWPRALQSKLGQPSNLQVSRSTGKLVDLDPYGCKEV